MNARKRFDTGDFGPFVFEADGRSYRFDECIVAAEIAYRPAGLNETVFQTPDGKFVYVIVVADDDQMRNPLGYSRGWYVASVIERAEVMRYRDSWSVFRDQPSAQFFGA